MAVPTAVIKKAVSAYIYIYIKVGWRRWRVDFVYGLEFGGVDTRALLRVSKWTTVF